MFKFVASVILVLPVITVKKEMVIYVTQNVKMALKVNKIPATQIVLKVSMMKTLFV